MGETKSQTSLSDSTNCAVRDVFNWLAEVDNRILKIDAHRSIEEVYCTVANAAP